jgi:hypothetical protein
MRSRRIIEAALRIAQQPPSGQVRDVRFTLVSWPSINELRLALDEAGIDWRTENKVDEVPRGQPGRHELWLRRKAAEQDNAMIRASNAPIRNAR